MPDTCEVRTAVIIPTLNEAEHIGALLAHLQASEAAADCIVVDAQSLDDTAAIAQAHGAQVVNSAVASRAVQMNLGAAHTNAELLYFVHADTRPPKTWFTDITNAAQAGHALGGYRFKFDSKRPLLKLNSWFTRFNLLTFRGGDQSLFVKRGLWDALEGFNPELCIMEEYDLMQRAKAAGEAFCLLKGATRVSARKYEHNGYLQVQRANFVAMRDYKRGLTSEAIRSNYYRMLRHPKA
ncbi:MAG: TIGR04283 family arsenosugar biosynthesis glycosyltransferase [Flavobacteriales bacterium]